MRCSAAAKPNPPMARRQPQNLRCTKQGSEPVGWDPFAKRTPAAAASSHRTSKRTALTLIELLLTLAVLGILAAILIPQLSGDLPERLSAAAQVVSTDLD